MLIRSPRPSDEQAWRALWSGYNTFYGVRIADSVTDVLWQHIVSDTGAVFARLAADAEGLAGFAVCVLHPFTWSAQPACLLEDFYVDPARRGVGVGRRLIDALRDEAAKKGWARLYWHTRHDNVTARRLYDSSARTASSATPSPSMLRSRQTAANQRAITSSRPDGCARVAAPLADDRTSPVMVITGLMAAGKSVVAEALAQRLPPAAHVRGDAFRRLSPMSTPRRGSPPWCRICTWERTYGSSLACCAITRSISRSSRRT